MITTKFSKIGSYHEGLNTENQDYLCSIDEKEFLMVMLADGATACEMGLEGARLSLEAVSQIIECEGASFFNYSKEKIAYLLIEQILYWIELKKEKGSDIEEYGSTFILAFMEKKTGRMVLANLGDGAIISIKKRGFSYLLKPKKFNGNPCLTTTVGANKAIDIKVEKLSFGDKIILCSDGCLEQLNKCKATAISNPYDLEALNRALQTTENTDDCSYISLTRWRK